jgi:hypothetical protein
VIQSEAISALVVAHRTLNRSQSSEQSEGGSTVIPISTGTRAPEGRDPAGMVGIADAPARRLPATPVAMTHPTSWYRMKHPAATEAWRLILR